MGGQTAPSMLEAVAIMDRGSGHRPRVNVMYGRYGSFPGLVDTVLWCLRRELARVLDGSEVFESGLVALSVGEHFVDELGQVELCSGSGPEADRSLDFRYLWFQSPPDRLHCGGDALIDRESVSGGLEPFGAGGGLGWRWSISRATEHFRQRMMALR